MSAQINVTLPAPAAAPATSPGTVSVSADLAKAYADAIAQAKTELATIEAALKGEETTVASWFKSNWAHVVTWAGIAAPTVLSLLKHV